MTKVKRYHEWAIVVAAIFSCMSAGPLPVQGETFIEPLKPNVPGAYDEEVLRRIKRARTDGALSTELWLTQNAAAGTPQHFELWDNVAELSCREARKLSNGASSDDRRLAMIRRETGLALVKEFRCAVSVARGERACFLAGPDERLSAFGLGAVPNPSVTPLCFQSLCGEGFRADSRHRKVAVIGRAQGDARKKRVEEEFSWVEQDAANIDLIEDYCRASGTGSGG